MSIQIIEYNQNKIVAKMPKKFITDFKTEPGEFDSDESLPDIPPPSYIEQKPQAKDDNNFKPSPPKKPIRYM